MSELVQESKVMSIINKIRYTIERTGETTFYSQSGLSHEEVEQIKVYIKACGWTTKNGKINGQAIIKVIPNKPIPIVPAITDNVICFVTRKSIK